MINVYDKIRLNTGEIGRILEDFGDGAYIAEIYTQSGEIDTTEITKDEIASVFEEVEKPVRTA